MSRNFNGTNQNVSWGSDVSIDDFTAKTVAFYTNIRTGAATTDLIICKANNTGTTGWALVVNTTTAVLQLTISWSGTDGSWTVPKPANGLHCIQITYAGAATTDNPVILVDGVSQTVTTVAVPTGTLDVDNAQSLVAGELTAGGGADYDGTIGWVLYHNAVLSAAELNRHRWWGRPFGGLKVYHPFVTDKLTNEGSATADGTATGATVASDVCAVVRPGMGMGW